MIFEGVDLSIWTGMVWYGKLQKSTMIWCVDQNSGYILSWGSGWLWVGSRIDFFASHFLFRHLAVAKRMRLSANSFPPAWTLKFLSKQVRNNQYSP